MEDDDLQKAWKAAKGAKTPGARLYIVLVLALAGLSMWWAWGKTNQIQTDLENDLNPAPGSEAYLRDQQLRRESEAAQKQMQEGLRQLDKAQQDMRRVIPAAGDSEPPLPPAR